MDQGMDRIVEDIKDIVETRTAIADKLEKLEQRFTSTVEEAKMMAETFTDRTQSMIDHTIESVKEATDPTRLVTRHPWIMMSGAILVGVAIGKVFRDNGRGVVPYYPPGSHAADVMPTTGSNDTPKDGVYPFYPQQSRDERFNPTSSVSPAPPSMFAGLAPAIAEGLGQVKGDLVELGITTLRTWLKEAVRGGMSNIQPIPDRQPAATKSSGATTDNGDRPRESQSMEG